MIRSLYLYARYFGATVFSAKAAFVFNDLYRYHLSRNRYYKGHQVDVKQKKLALAHAIDWLLRAQASTPDDGMGSYHLVKGWSASYPETTGYIIPTLLQYAGDRNDSNIAGAAVRAADWLMAIQHASGGWQGGRVNEDRPPVVFNTAQVIRGLLAVYRLSKDDKYLDSAVRAGNWLCDIQGNDGTWTKSALMGQARVYDSYVDQPLLMLHKATGMERFRTHAVRNLDWIVGRKQHQNAWFEDCDNTVKRNDRPILHTIAYTIDGLLDCGIYLDDRRYIDAARKAADVLKDKFERDGFLHGRYGNGWEGSEHMILTGCAQMSVVWQKMAHYSGIREYAITASAMNSLLVMLQRRNHGSRYAGTNGALNGSYPLWGRYEPFACPNWATKYLADALMLEVNQ
jgi:hypothetical protein